MDTFIAACWVVFGIYWAAASLTAKPSEKREGLLGRLWYSSFFSLGFVMIVGLSPFDSYPLGLSIMPKAAAVAAYLVMAAGLALAIWARITIGSNWSGSVDLKKGHSLVVHGPYAYARHPIYTAVLLMLLATAISMGSLGSFLGLIPCFASFWIKLGREELLMTRHFPSEYPAYKARVKALIPSVF